MDALLWELLAEGSPGDRVEVLIKVSDLSTLPLDLIEVVAQIGNILSCRIRRGDIEAIRANDAVLSMKGPRTLTFDPLLAEEQFDILKEDLNQIANPRRPDILFTGKGVALGIADWGIDFTHPNFIHPDGSARFIAIWDQGANYDEVNPYGYGKIHYWDDINNALTAEFPFQELEYYPGKQDVFHQGMHGTHVLDIAAGNGTVGESGIAPEADLIAVHLATDKFKDLMGLGDSVRVFDALHFLDRIAGDQPLVVNMSVGSHGDAHTGRSLIEQAIDNLVASKNNRSVVQSCGNYYSAQIHTKGTLDTGEQISLEWLISDQDKTPNEIEIWYESQDDIQVDLRTPEGRLVLKQQGVGRSSMLEEDGDEIGRYYHRQNEPNTGLSQILIILNAQSQSGKWEVLLTGKQITNGRYEAWIERDIRSGSNQSRFPLHQTDPNSTTGSICNGLYSISVGAYNPHDPYNRIGSFTSVGPTWDGREKPDLVAPGVGILAAKSASPYQNCSEGELTTRTGTSMAAPYVAGAIALLYEASKTPLSIHEVRSRLLQACSLPASNSTLEKRRYGNGILKIEKLFSTHLSEPSAFQPKISDNMETYKFDPQYDYTETLTKEVFEELSTSDELQSTLKNEDAADYLDSQDTATEFSLEDTSDEFYEELDEVLESQSMDNEEKTTNQFDVQSASMESSSEYFQESLNNSFESQSADIVYAEHTNYLNPQYAPIESLLEACQEEFPVLSEGDLVEFFESLPAVKTPMNDLGIQRGDILVRRQYGHYEPAWHGVIEFVYDREAYVHTPQGRRKVWLSRDGRCLDWELRTIRPGYDEINTQLANEYFSNSQYVENFSSSFTLVNAPTCSIDDTKKNKIGFEFDMLIGFTNDLKKNTIASDTIISEHTQAVEGFELKIDGNKIEISTKPFELSSSGLKDLTDTFTRINQWIKDLISNFKMHEKRVKIKKDASCSDCFSGEGVYVETSQSGKALKIKDEFITPNHFLFPLKNARSNKADYFTSDFGVRAVLQATMGIPLTSVNKLVDKIKQTENKPVGIGLSVSGSKWRLGLRSDALYNAQYRTNSARKYFLDKGIHGTLKIDKNNFTDTLNGFLILLTQYFWTSVLPEDARDTEGFSKAYVPLHSKTRFREMFHCLLNDAEKDLFKKVFWEGDNWKNLFSLAKKIEGRRGGYNDINDTPDITLFPKFISGKPTWGEFVNSIVENNFSFEKDTGRNSLVTGPTSGAIPLKTRGVVLELRRMGFGTLRSKSWLNMATSLFNIAMEFNK